MSIRLYDTLEKEKRAFEPREPGRVRMYNCGPTVYGRAHIGNLRSFLFADLLRRWLEVRGFEVRQVMNLTDVGHMTQDDEDHGTDKLENQARKESRSPWEIAQQWIDVFHQDLEALGVRPAHEYPRATDHIAQMLEIIERLMEQGHAYEKNGAVYFSVQSFPRYGALSGNRIEDLEAGARLDVHPDKKHPADFALWKSDPQHLMKWDSRFGPDGFPGWHIECSAMAREHLGDELDIHTGGEDNVFPHHECEIAQSEAFSGQRFARHWMHAKFLQVDGGKMSKSLGNVYSLDDVRERGFEPRAFRYALLTGHYRQPLNFTWKLMADSAKALEKLDDLVLRLRERAGEEGAADAEASAAVAEDRRAFEEAMDDDLLTPKALASLFGLRDRALRGELCPAAAQAGMDFLEQVVQPAFGVLQLEEQSLDDEVEALIQARQTARANKDWGEADRIRDALSAMGIVLEDSADGVRWRRGG